MNIQHCIIVHLFVPLFSRVMIETRGKVGDTMVGEQISKLVYCNSYGYITN